MTSRRNRPTNRATTHTNRTTNNRATNRPTCPLNHRDENGDTTLLRAIKSGDGDIERIKGLIDARNVNVANRLDGTTPLMAVLMHVTTPVNITLIRLMLEEGANVHAFNDIRRSVLFHVDPTDVIAYRMLIGAGIDIDEESLECECRHTVLVSAIQHNDQDGLRMFINLGANVNHRHIGGLPLDMAIRKGFMECADILEDAGAIRAQ